jgi:hypothetical protein
MAVEAAAEALSVIPLQDLMDPLAAAAVLNLHLLHPVALQFMDPKDLQVALPITQPLLLAAVEAQELLVVLALQQLVVTVVQVCWVTSPHPSALPHPITLAVVVVVAPITHHQQVQISKELEELVVVHQVP